MLLHEPKLQTLLARSRTQQNAGQGFGNDLGRISISCRSSVRPALSRLRELGIFKFLFPTVDCIPVVLDELPLSINVLRLESVEQEVLDVIFNCPAKLNLQE